jgi:hypothetical protein
MPTTLTRYTWVHQVPLFIRRGRTTTARIDLESAAGTAETPTALTFTLVDDSGTKVLDGVTATAGDPSTHPVTIAEVPATQALSDEWQVRWLVTHSDGSVQEYTEQAIICRRVPHQTVGVSDLTTAEPMVSGTNFLASGKTHQNYLDAALFSLHRKLLSIDRRPELVLNPYGFHDWLLADTLVRELGQAASALNAGPDSWLRERIGYWMDVRQSAWSDFKPRYDADEDDIVDDPTPLEPVVYASGGRGGMPVGSIF